MLKITSPHGSALLPADIEARSEKELLARAADALPADVLIAPHHGSRTSSTEDFIEQVDPALVVFTVGYWNRFGHPRPQVIERYKALGARLLRSDEDGAVLIRFEPETGISVHAYRKEHRRYWNDS